MNVPVIKDVYTYIRPYECACNQQQHQLQTLKVRQRSIQTIANNIKKSTSNREVLPVRPIPALQCTTIGGPLGCPYNKIHNY